MEKYFTSLIDQCFDLMFQTKDEVSYKTKKIIVLMVLFIITAIVAYLIL